ncbi:MAG TPA: tetratricopeptide repeat protein [Polyangiaceae bacterium]|nr:tetratricopeptide repeat protein [Polyangiaceae bacterium]
MSGAGHAAVATGGLANPPLRLADPNSFGELELPDASPSVPPPKPPKSSELEADVLGAPAGSAPALQGGAEVVRQAGGGVTYGEVNLDGGEVLPDVPSPAASADDMEFGAIPQEAPKPSTRLQAPGVVRPAPTVAARESVDAPRVLPPKRSRGRVVALVFALVAIGGGALAMVPEIGPFGAYWISDRLKGGEHQKLVASAVGAARAELATDTYPAAQQALRVIEEARGRAKRVDALAAYTAFVGYARDLRFGAEPELRARAQVLLEDMKDVSGDRYVELARAGQAIVSGQLARARQQLESLAQSDARDVDAWVLRGELELKAKEPAAALTAWTSAAGVEKSSRTTFGLARAHDASGAGPAALAAAQSVLQTNPKHTGARILVARLTLREAEADSVRALEAVVAEPAAASPEEIVAAQTLLGEIHLRRWRVSRAEAAYSEALKINPKNARALVGLGDALYRAGRFSEALARFEAAVQADPEEIAAKVGVAKAKLSLEQQQDAAAMLKALLDAHPKSMRVAYWYGKVLEAGGNKNEAEKAYRAAIEHGQSDPDVVDAYIALSQLLNQEGRRADAQKTLADARATLKDSSSIHLGLGELSLSEGRHADAIKEFRAALRSDPSDLTAKFRLGVGLRRNRQFEEAQKLFEAVAAVDRDYPGLALERGLLYEASGRAEEALVAYEAALAKAPNDPDLMLRVGCGKIAAGRAEQAAVMLRKVLSSRPNSAETNHCLGRALLVEGKSLAEALRILERATELDANRAEYWLYVGWAANEAGRVAKAEESLDKALALDQSLADAYWQRGVLRGRQGAVKDAVKDLLRALELRPTRYEAHAALADAYDELGLETEALAEWEKAVAAEPENALWAFRYGKLLAANRRNDPARAQLSKAIELGERLDPKPLWLAEAHLQMARALATRPEAVKHWHAFLQSGSRDSAYRDEAKEMLKKLGKPWDGD